MATRLKRRRFGRRQTSENNAGTTGVIKIGFRLPLRQGKTHRLPGKLNGFMLCRDTVDVNGDWVVDEAAMLALGSQYTLEAVAKAKSLGQKAPLDLLPTEVPFMLMQNAVKVGEEWEYSHTLTEEYLVFGKEGVFCHGDGARAERTQDDETKREIACVPVGCKTDGGEKVCPYSENGDCKPRGTLVICPFVVGENGKPEPLCSTFGWSAKFRFGTGSEVALMTLRSVLDALANRLNGWIDGIPGMLAFQTKSRITPPGSQVSRAMVGGVILSIDEVSVRAREREIWAREAEQHNRAIELRKVMLLGAPEDVEASSELSGVIEPDDPTVGDDEPSEALTPDVLPAEAPANKPASEAVETEASDPELPGGEPESRRVYVDARDDERAATVAEMLAALREYAEQTYPRANGLKAVCTYQAADPKTDKARDYWPPSWQFFTDPNASTQPMDQRENFLRWCCRRLENDPSADFEIWSRE